MLINNYATLNKYPLLITLCFFVIMSYVTFFHHQFWGEGESDGVFYLFVGQDILHGNGKNVYIVDAPSGGPTLFAVLDSFFHNGFYVEKIVSLLSGTGIVFVSYFVLRNIFNHKIALLGQLFFVFNPRLDLLTILSLNDALPILLISISWYFITKKNLNFSNIVITGIVLGIAFMIRYQALVVLIAFMVFLLIRNRKIRTNIVSVALMGIFFLIVASPMLVYNYSVHGTIIDSSPNLLIGGNWQYKNPQFVENMRVHLMNYGGQLGFFSNFDLFLKNYFYNLFYNDPNLLFNFITADTLSIIPPPIPFLGIIPVVGGFVYCLNMKLKRVNLVIFSGVSIVTALLVFMSGNITTYFFTIIIIPLLTLGLLNFRNIEKNFLPLLVLSVVFPLMISVIFLSRSYQLFSMWIAVVTLSAVFFVEVVPKIFYGIKKMISKREYNGLAVKTSTLLIISSVLLLNAGFSYALSFMYLYPHTFTGIKNEIVELFQKHNSIQETGYINKQVGDILAKQQGIENAYVMAPASNYAYYANSKFVYAGFTEGPKNDTIDKYITRENWAPYELWVSNFFSHPEDRFNMKKPTPDYLIYEKELPLYYTITNYNVPQTDNYAFLLDPHDPKIPTNFKLLYQSNDVVVYKINH